MPDAPTTLTGTARFHISLNVSDIGRAIDFYRVLFGIEPAKVHDDYAKFDVLDPPVVFSLAPSQPASGWSLSHLGLRVTDVDAIREIQQRLEAHGIDTQCEQGVECGYARQSKCWVRDLDNNFWEIYVIKEEIDADVPPVELRSAAAEQQNPAAGPPPSAVWEHRVTQDIPSRISYPDGSLDEVRLEGTFNSDCAIENRMSLLADARRVLKPHGRVLLHALAADKALPGEFPKLPGVAAFVKRLPLECELPGALRDAGFQDIYFETFAESAAFRHDGVEMRELRVVASNPVTATSEYRSDEQRHVLYKGPLAQVTDEAGRVFHRGSRVAVDATTYEQLRHGALADAFLFLNTDPHREAGNGCGTTSSSTEC